MLYDSEEFYYELENKFPKLYKRFIELFDNGSETSSNFIRNIIRMSLCDWDEQSWVETMEYIKKNKHLYDMWVL